METQRRTKVKQLPSRKQKLQEGALVQGPDHEQGGVEVVDQQSQEPVAEVEGGERIFSQEDTQVMEQMAAQIVQLAAQNPQGADQAAKQLGYAVVEMISKQEQVAQERGMAQPDADMIYADAANTFANTEV